MDWLEGLPRVLAVVAGSIGAGVLALAAARLLRIDRVLASVAPPRIPTPEEQVRTLAGLADLAHREGLLSVEASAARMQDDFLLRGVALALEGLPAEDIRQRLEEEIDAANAEASLGRRLVFRAAQVPQLATIVGAAAMLGVLLVYGTDPASADTAGLVAIVLFAGGLIAGATVGPAADRVAARQALLVMNRLLQAEAIALIRAGADARAVESRLRAMLPAGDAAAPSLARAA